MDEDSTNLSSLNRKFNLTPGEQWFIWNNWGESWDPMVREQPKEKVWQPPLSFSPPESTSTRLHTIYEEVLPTETYKRDCVKTKEALVKKVKPFELDLVPFGSLISDLLLNEGDLDFVGRRKHHHVVGDDYLLKKANVKILKRVYQSLRRG